MSEEEEGMATHEHSDITKEDRERIDREKLGFPKQTRSITLGKESDMFESTQTVDVVYGDHAWEMEFTISLRCTQHSSPGRPGDIDWPHEAPTDPEFEVVYVYFFTNHGDLNFKISYVIFWDIVGREIAEELYEKAVHEAIESGEF